MGHDRLSGEEEVRGRRGALCPGRITNTRGSAPYYFVPVGDEIRDIVVDWVTYLRQTKLWGNDDPLFPATEMVVGANRRFEVAGLKRQHWSGAAPIRAIFRRAFQSAGVRYFNPHSMRDMLVHLGQTLCKSPEEFKAFSQNLGHEAVLTTFNSYGQVGGRRQSEIIRGLGSPRPRERSDADEIAEAVARKLGHSMA